MNDIAVVKIGGALLENTPDAVAKIVGLHNQNPQLVVVHGGGLQITRMLEKMHVQSQFIDGLRVTDEITLQAVAAALMGEVHTSLVAGLQTAGVPVAGVFGAIHAQKKSGPWGLVGTAVRADSSILNALLKGGRVPVIATLALGDSGRASLLNVNGDETASAVALFLQASKLIFLTDVEGVRGADGATIQRVPRGVSLIDEPFVSGGMKPKLRAVEAALAGGVANVSVGKTVFGSAS
jgi:acetylglutamate kinase